MLKRITIAVPENVAERLDRLARSEFRDRRQQAAALLLDGLERAEKRAAEREQTPETVR